MNKYLLIIPLILLLFSNAFSQDDDCYTILDNAEVMYEEGIIEEIPSMLAPCIEKGFTREQKLRAYKLIIFAYLFDDNQLEAEKAMLNFLRKYPEYETRRNDPVEFVYLFNSYKTSIDYSFGVMGGFNLSNYVLKEPYFTGADSADINLDNTGLLGSHFGFQLNRYISDRFEVSLEVFHTRNNFRLTENSTGEIETKEKQVRWDIPISISYLFDYKDLNPYFRVGGGIRYLSNSTLSSENGDYIITDHRKTLNYWAFAGGGVKYKVPRGYAFVDIRYCLNFLNNTNEDNRKSNLELILKEKYVDDDFRLDNTMISVGYILLLYRPSN